MSVATHLGIDLGEYDARIRTFIPHYEEMLDVAAGSLAGCVADADEDGEARSAWSGGAAAAVVVATWTPVIAQSPGGAWTVNVLAAASPMCTGFAVDLTVNGWAGWLPAARRQ